MPAIAVVIIPGVVLIRPNTARVITVDASEAKAIRPAPMNTPSGVIELARIHSNIVPATTRPSVPTTKVITGRPIRLMPSQPSAAPPNITSAANNMATTGLNAPVVSSSAAASSGSTSSVPDPAGG